MPTSNKAFQRFLTHGLALAVSATLSAGLATTVSAQTSALAENFPEVASLNNAFDVTQAALLDAMAEINANPETMQARMEVQMQLDMAKDMDGHAHMGHGGGEMSMNMGSPYDELEVQARVALTEMLRQSHTMRLHKMPFQNPLLCRPTLGGCFPGVASLNGISQTSLRTARLLDLKSGPR